MRTNAERIKCVCLKAAVLRRKREHRKEAFYKTASIMLTCLLVYCISTFSKPYQSAAVLQHCGTILLVGGIGGYILTAVVTFIVATIITVVCIKSEKRRKTK